MNTTRWKWLKEIRFHAHFSGDQFTGYRIKVLEADDHLEPFVGHHSGQFNLIFPGGDAAVTYDTLEEAKEAAEWLYELEQASRDLPA